MNRKEIADLLEIVISNYPNTKIKDAGAMVSAWEMGLGDLPAKSVYKAARFHLETSPFFPTIADIREKILRAELVYKDAEPDVKKIEGSGARTTEKSLMDEDEYLENLCKFVGLGYPNDMENDVD